MQSGKIQAISACAGSMSRLMNFPGLTSSRFQSGENGGAFCTTVRPACERCTRINGKRSFIRIHSGTQYAPLHRRQHSGNDLRQLLGAGGKTAEAVARG
jgi:hypothetical protein